MLARILRIGAALEVLAALALIALLVRVGLPSWLAVALGLLLPLALHGVLLAIEFVTGALVDRRPVARLSPWALARVWLGETWRSFKVFNVDQPWRAGFPEPAIVRDAGRHAVLFVHGYLCNRADLATVVARRRPGPALELRDGQPRTGVRRGRTLS